MIVVSCGTVSAGTVAVRAWLVRRAWVGAAGRCSGGGVAAAVACGGARVAGGRRAAIAAVYALPQHAAERVVVTL
eukprot:1823926-Prymnesium_polylepis.1